MDRRGELIRRLADGRLHSGAVLAAELGVSRSAIWKAVRQLEPLGLEVQAGPGRGYRLRQPIDLLQRESLMRWLDPATRSAIESLDLCLVTDSTSSRLLQSPAPEPGRMRACLAEFQSSGRGRRGRRWFSPLGSGLCLSVSWCFASAPRDLPALSLVAGLAVCRALEAVGARGQTLKWPNDVVRQGRKLAGVLVDVTGEAGGPLKAVIGAGLNLNVPRRLEQLVAAQGGIPPIGPQTDLPGKPLCRNRLAAALLDAFYAALSQFAQYGFTPFAQEWRRADYLVGRPVVVQSGAEQHVGVAAGIAPDGALLLAREGAIAAILSGEVTVREVT